MKHSQRYSAENSIFIFLSFAVAGGFLEAFTYLLHGGVFCNAQTGNLVLFTLNLCTGEFSNASRYLFSILAYLFGILVSAILPTILKRKHPYIAVAGFEIIALAAISFIPKTLPIGSLTFPSLSCAPFNTTLSPIAAAQNWPPLSAQTICARPFSTCTAESSKKQIQTPQERDLYHRHHCLYRRRGSRRIHRSIPRQLFGSRLRHCLAPRFLPYSLR